MPHRLDIFVRGKMPKMSEDMLRARCHDYGCQAPELQRELATAQTKLSESLTANANCAIALEKAQTELAAAEAALAEAQGRLAAYQQDFPALIKEHAALKAKVKAMDRRKDNSGGILAYHYKRNPELDRRRI